MASTPRRRGIRRTTGEIVFAVVNAVVLILVAAICLFPFLHELARSVSLESAIVSGRVSIVPVGFNLHSYTAVFQNSSMNQALKFTVALTVLGTSVNLLVTAAGAYPLSKRRLTGRRGIWLFILLTMFFSGGLIPTYLIVRAAGLLDRIWALILPTAVNTFNLIIMKTFYQGIPESLEESARMDGCSDIGILVRIVLPLSLPILATLTLFYSVSHWNQFFSALLYMNDTKKWTLQLKLRQMVIQDNVQMAMEGSPFGQEIPRESIKAAAVMYATVPILVIYPWLQKYFVKGALVGSLKG